jgi:hypothetical protein
MKRILLIVSLLILWSLQATATTWDEPWQDEVISDADAFVKAIVTANTAGKQLNLRTLENVAGVEVPDQVVVREFSLLRLASRSDDVEFTLTPGTVAYFFLSRGEGSNGWAIATPTTGFAALQGTSVIATYRHSYHMALVPETLYRWTMKALFNKVHGNPVDEAKMRAFIEAELAEPPQGAPEQSSTDEQTLRFSTQHVALESLVFFSNADDLQRLEPFLKINSCHVQISAVRALSSIDDSTARARLFSFLREDACGFAMVMAVQGLREQGATEYLEKLKEYLPEASNEVTGFGGNLMDPRVGTSFPASVRAAVKALVDEWSAQ